MDTFHTFSSQVGTSGQHWDNAAQNNRGQYFHGVSKTCLQSSLEQGDIPSSPRRLTKLKIQILLNDVTQSINHMQGELNTMQGQCIELQTAISKVVSDESQIQKNKSMKIITAAKVSAQKEEILQASGLIPAQREGILQTASVPAQREGILSAASITAQREEILRASGLIPAQREEILLTACVPVKNGNNHPQPPPIIPMVAPLWKWDGGACTPPVDFYSKRRDVRLRYVEHPALMSITKPEHSEANPQCQTGSRPVAEPETPAVHNNSGGWLSWVFGSGRVKKKEVHLPEDKDRSIVWDPTLHRWVNKTEPKAENKFVLPPPPMGTYGYQGNTGSVPKGVNPYSMKAVPAGLWGSRYPTMHYSDGTNSKPPSHGPGLLPRQLSGLLPPSHFDLMAPMVVPPDTLPY